MEATGVGAAVKLLDDVWAFRISVFQQSYMVVSNKRAILIDAVHTATYNSIVQLLKSQDIHLDAIILTHGGLVKDFNTTRKSNHLLNSVPALIHRLDLMPNAGLSDICEYTDLLAAFKIRHWNFKGHTPGSIILSYDQHGGTIFAGHCAIGSPFNADENTLVRPLLSHEDDEMLIAEWENLNIDIRHILPMYGKPVLDLAGFDEVADVVLHLIEPDGKVKKRMPMSLPSFRQLKRL